MLLKKSKLSIHSLPLKLYNVLSFYRSQNVLGWSEFFCARPKNYLHIVAVTNILCQAKIWFAFSKIVFCASAKVFEESLMPCPFTGRKMFCIGPNFLSQPKNLTAFSASSKTFVPAQKPILLNVNHLFVWHKMFVTGTICKYIFGPTQKIWTGTKHFATCKRTRH